MDHFSSNTFKQQLFFCLTCCLSYPYQGTVMAAPMVTCAMAALQPAQSFALESTSLCTVILSYCHTLYTQYGIYSVIHGHLVIIGHDSPKRAILLTSSTASGEFLLSPSRGSQQYCPFGTVMATPTRDLRHLPPLPLVHSLQCPHGVWRFIMCRFILCFLCLYLWQQTRWIIDA